MATDLETDIDRWDRTSWLWVFICAAAIFAVVPVARSLQEFVYDTVGKEFFTYAVIAVIGTGSAVLLYVLIFRWRVRSLSQYLWLFVCGGIYVNLALKLREHPEEAVHLIQFGMLSYFVFRALSHRIRDWTVYITAFLFVSFFGILDELIQWMIPGRIWDYRDIGINALAGGIFLIGIWKGIRPGIISGPVRRISVSVLTWIFTVNLILLALCLSNTPDAVKRYSGAFDGLSWLQHEETMTEYGYDNNDPEAAAFSSGNTGRIITLFDLGTVWITAVSLTLFAWACSIWWRKRLNAG